MNDLMRSLCFSGFVASMLMVPTACKEATVSIEKRPEEEAGLLSLFEFSDHANSTREHPEIWLVKEKATDKQYMLIRAGGLVVIPVTDPKQVEPKKPPALEEITLPTVEQFNLRP